MAADNVMYITIVADDNSPAVSVQQEYLTDGGDPRVGINKLINYLHKVLAGNCNAKVHVALGGADTGTAATGTIACVQASISDGDYVDIGNVRLTARTSPSSDPGAGEFAFLTSNTVTGAALAACINAHPRLNGLLTGANSSGTVTLTMDDKGLHGNLLNLAKSGSGFTVTSPTNGAEGTLQSGLRTYRRGL